MHLIGWFARMEQGGSAEEPQAGDLSLPTRESRLAGPNGAEDHGFGLQEALAASENSANAQNGRWRLNLPQHWRIS